MVEEYQQAISVANLGGIRDVQGLYPQLGLKNSPQVLIIDLLFSQFEFYPAFPWKFVFHLINQCNRQLSKTFCQLSTDADSIDFEESK